MRLWKPLAITEANVVACSLVDTLAPAVSAVSYTTWVSTTTYAVNAVVISPFSLTDPDSGVVSSYLGVFTSYFSGNINYEPAKPASAYTGSGTLPGRTMWAPTGELLSLFATGKVAVKWATGTTYALGATVGYINGATGAFYTSLIASNTGNTPSSSPSAWRQSTADSYATYSSGTTYASGDRVCILFGTLGKSYISLAAANLGNEPSASPTWWGYEGDAYRGYAAATTYALADRVYDPGTRHNFESLAASNTGNALTSTLKWLDLGSSNRWAMFDTVNNTQSQAGATMSFTVAPPALCDSLALINMEASQAWIVGRRTVATNRNLLLWTEDFTNAYWTATGVTVTANTVTAPDGNTTAETITASTTGTTAAGVLRALVTTTGASYSVYAKAGTAGFAALANNTTGSSWAQFNLTTGAVVSSAGCTASTVDKGNGWWQLIMANATTAGANVIVQAMNSTVAGNPWAGAPTTAGNTAYIWGAQAEQATAVTTYQRVDAAYSGVDMVYLQYFNMALTSFITDWRHYFFDPISYKSDMIIGDLPLVNAMQVNVILTRTGGTVKLGTVAFGQATNLGGTIYGAQPGIIDFSTKETDSFGTVTLVQRAYARRSQFKVVCANTQIDAIYNQLASLRATPVLYQGSDTYGSTWAFGFFRDFTISIDQPQQSYLTIEIEGLT